LPVYYYSTSRGVNFNSKYRRIYNESQFGTLKWYFTCKYLNISIKLKKQPWWQIVFIDFVWVKTVPFQQLNTCDTNTTCEMSLFSAVHRTCASNEKDFQSKMWDWRTNDLKVLKFVCFNFVCLNEMFFFCLYFFILLPGCIFF